MTIQPYLLVPKVIPQPTWGGTYIYEFKHLPKECAQLAIGQSYELSSQSKFSTVSNSIGLPVEIGVAADGSTQEVIGDPHSMISLQELIDENPEGVLGKHVVQTHGNTMKVLIKFTQAKGNSFQVHVRPGFAVGNWKPKPESWYFFEKGKVTLGIQKQARLQEYKDVCLGIEALSNSLSSKVKEKSLSIQQAREQLSAYIKLHSPFDFVQELLLEKESIVDLSAGGIHHSWEEGEEIPQGNIVYEVQLNVMDNECTLRSFDKGKIADDGTVRSVNINDYFLALDSDEKKNEVSSYMRLPVYENKEGAECAQLFSTLNYSSQLLKIAGEYQMNMGPDGQSFHHLFVKSGMIELHTGNVSLFISQGASVFVPASTGTYTLITKGVAQVIKTWV